jgi:putative Mg2+ transporter-C (MgtC) family protein
MDFPWYEIIKIVSAFTAGLVLGLEREYRDKPAGLRTIILITVGSALFSLLSISLETTSPGRIAANVVTGVGFLGAGVIFKEGLNVKGLTSAATIWVAAAIGMALGFGNYYIAVITLVLTLVVLTILQKLEKKIDTDLDHREFKFTFHANEFSVNELEKQFDDRNIECERMKILLKDNELTVAYHLQISSVQVNELIQFVLHHHSINRFEEV